MRTPLPDIRDIAVPPESQALQDALGDLDQKLAAFTSAMQTVEALLSQIAQPQEAARETAPRGRFKGRTAKAGQAQEGVPQEAPPPPQATQPQAQTEVHEARPEAQAGAVQEPRPRGEDLPVESSAAKEVAPADTPPAQGPQVQAVRPESSPGQTPPQEAAPAAPSEDEVLLASLDEATVKVIKVMRRLEPNKPVKELLKRIEERKDQPVQTAKPASRSWFKRR